MRPAHCLLLLIVAALQGCVDKAAARPDTGSSPADDTGRPDSSGDDSSADTATCDTAAFAALATPEEIAVTPRDDEEAEGLAICLATGLVAFEEVYERLLTDLDAIRGAWPQLEEVEYRASPDLYDVWLRMELEVAEEVESGTYRDWDCIHSYFDAVRVNPVVPLDDYAFVQVELEGRYDTDVLAEIYVGLRGVLEAEGARGPAGDSDGSNIGGLIDGGTYHYVFDYGDGDCPSGCVYHHYTYVVTETPGAPTLIDTWDRGEGATDTGDAPDWLSMSNCP